MTLYLWLILLAEVASSDRSIVRSKTRGRGLFATEPINAIAHHQNPHILLRSPFYQADERQIRTIHCRKGASWEACGLDGQVIIRREILDDVYIRVRHVTNADHCRR